MLLDARRIEPDTRIDADICIVGAGAAGITLAGRLARTGLEVVVLESGGIEPEGETQALNRGTNAGIEYYPLDSARLRYLGGTTNHWTGWTRPLDAIDFERREGIPGSGWPITRADLDKYYPQAEVSVELGKHRFDPAYWESLLGRRFPLQGGNVLTSIVRHSPPTRFGETYLGFLQRSETVSVFLYANATEFDLDESRRNVTAVRATVLGGKQFTVRAKQYVLATGGIENARLLLANRRYHANGLGNQHDLVGRYFADHRGTVFGTFVASPADFRVEQYATTVVKDHADRAIAAITPGLTLATDIFRNRRLPNTGCVITIADLPPATNPLFAGGRPGVAFSLIGSVEPLPNPDSRVRLSAEKDALGLPMPVLEFRMHPDYEARCAQVADAFAEQFALAGLGRGNTTLKAPFPPTIHRYGYHHMGTTRMHDDPRQGVVDRDCRVHGLGNLYVAGSSVFTTFGYAQPTLTIVALALRLADTLYFRVTGKS